MSRLPAIEAKLRAGERLDADDGLALFLEPDLLRLGQLANGVRERLHGDRTYFNVNMRLEVTNVCEASCSFCAFRQPCLEKNRQQDFQFLLDTLYDKRDKHYWVKELSTDKQGGE